MPGTQRWSWIVAGIALGALCAVAPARAATFTIGFTAVVTDTKGDLPFDEGDLVAGSFRYDDGLSISFSDGDTMGYDATGAISFAVADLLPGGSVNQLLVSDGASDVFELRSSSLFDSTFLRLVDATGSVFSSQDIPTSLPLSAFSSATFELDLSGTGLFSGEIVSLSIPVPEPGSVALLALGLTGLGLRRRR